MRTLGVLHDGPTDLRTPGALVRSVQRSHQVVLPQRPVRGTLITRHVSCQGSIGYVDTSMRACVYASSLSHASKSIQVRLKPSLSTSIDRSHVRQAAVEKGQCLSLARKFYW